MAWLSFDDGDRPAANNLILLAKPRELELCDPQLSFTVSGAGTDFTVAVQVRHPALWVWLDIPGVDARFSDNFVHVAPDAPAKFKVKLTQAMTQKELMKVLQAHSLFDTSNHHPL